MKVTEIRARLNRDAASWWVTGDGVSRTPLVPTRRFGEPVLISATYAVRRSGLPPRPDTWLAIERDFADVAAFARTDVLDPIASLDIADWSSALEPAGGSAREIHATVRDLQDEVVDAFCAGSDPAPSARVAYAAALRGVVPLELQGWLLTCCSDFWTWATA